MDQQDTDLVVVSEECLLVAELFFVPEVVRMQQV
jgi:hypothetical protein